VASNLKHCCKFASVIFALTVIPLGFAAEPNLRPRSVTLGYEVDDADAYQLNAILQLPIKAQGYGRLRFATGQWVSAGEQFDTRRASLTAGFDHERWSFRGTLSHFADSESLRQWEFLVGAQYFGSRFTAGVTLMHRDTADEDLLSFERRRREPLEFKLTQDVSGDGLMVDGEYYLADAWSVFANYKFYDYETTSNAPRLLRILSTRFSRVTQDVSLVEHSATLGLTRRFSRSLLTLSYSEDAIFQDVDTIRSTQLLLNIDATERFSVAPGVGYSSSEATDDIVYASVDFRWIW
jgi:hypothetical protein